MRFGFFIYVIIGCLTLNANDFSKSDPDSVLKLQISDSLKIEKIVEMATVFEDSLPEVTISYLEEALNFADSKSMYKRAAELANNIGQQLYYLGNYQKAGSYFSRASDYYKKLNLKEGIANCLNNLGSIYIELEDNEKALQYYKNALALYTEASKGSEISLNQIAMANGNIGRCYYYMNDFDKAREYYLRALEISEKTGDSNRISLMLNNLGSIFAERQNYDSALIYFQQSYKIQQEVDNVPMLVTVINNLGEIYRKTKDYKHSIEAFNEGLKKSKEIFFLDGQKISYKGLQDVYCETGDYQNAYKFQGLYFLIKDSLFNEENTGKLNELLTKFDAEKKEQEIERLHQEEVIRGFWQKALIVGVVLLILIAFLLFSKNRSTQKSKKIIENQKELIEEKQKEIVDSIVYAKRIQDALLANRELISEFLPDNFIFFRPKDIVSGDFFWATVKEIKSDKGSKRLLYLAVCDSTGHGVPGAFMSLLNIGFLSEAINEKNILFPGEVFDYVRDRLKESISKEGQQDGFDGVLLCFDILEKSFTYAAANCAPLVVGEDSYNELPYDRMPVGKGEKDTPFNTFNYKAEKGTELYVYTDGYPDQFGGTHGKKFKYRQLNEMLNAIKHLSAKEQADKLEMKFDEWKGNLEQVDDVCVIGIRL